MIIKKIKFGNRLSTRGLRTKKKLIKSKNRKINAVKYFFLKNVEKANGKNSLQDINIYSSWRRKPIKIQYPWQINIPINIHLKVLIIIFFLFLSTVRLYDLFRFFRSSAVGRILVWIKHQICLSIFAVVILIL